MNSERSERRHRGVGKHLLVDCSGVDPARLRDGKLLRRVLRESARRAGATIVGGPSLRTFPGGGVTGVVLLAESHVALHTYPELGYIALDAFTCGDCDPEAIVACVRALLAPQRVAVRRVRRAAPLSNARVSGRNRRT